MYIHSTSWLALWIYANIAEITDHVTDYDIYKDSRGSRDAIELYKASQLTLID